MCIELNAHASIILFLHCVKCCLTVACLGCSDPSLVMSSVFSTVINLGCSDFFEGCTVQVQICLETELQESGIKYPHVKAHKPKDGHGVLLQNIYLSLTLQANNFNVLLYICCILDHTTLKMVPGRHKRTITTI